VLTCHTIFGDHEWGRALVEASGIDWYGAQAALFVSLRIVMATADRRRYGSVLEHPFRSSPRRP